MISKEDVQAAKARFSADGFFIVDRPLLSTSQIEAGIAGMDAVREGTYETGVPPRPSPWNPGDDLDTLCKIEMPQIADLRIYECLTSEALGSWAAAVTGAKMVQVWWVQLLYKPPTKPGVEATTTVGWHQDFQYWQDNWEEDSELFTAWLALSDVGATSGPMSFVEGSHRWGFRNEGDFFGQNQAEVLETISVPRGESWRETTCLLPAGGVSFHDRLTYHGSEPNVSSMPRRSFAIHLRTERSALKNDSKHGLTEFLDDPDYCPVIFDNRASRP